MKSLAAGYLAVLCGLRDLSGVVILTIFVLIVADVFMRLLGIPPWTYIAAIVEYSLLWFTMLAAPYLVRVKGHVFIDAITQILPPGPRRVIASFAYLVCIVSSLTFFWYSFELLIEAFASGQVDTRGEDMPLWILLLPIPPCFLLVAVEFGRYLIGIDTMYGDRVDVKETV